MPVFGRALEAVRGRRECLPGRRRSWTQKLRLRDAHGAEQTFFVSFGEYDDGRLAELWVEASREGTFTRGVLGALGRVVSVALQCGAPPAELVKAMRGLSFPPQGAVTGEGAAAGECSSLVDWIAREIEAVYVTESQDKEA